MIIAVVGISGSGKDTLAKHISERFNIPILVSYTTRPMRDYETDGVEHYFITKEQMENIKQNEKMIAYTINEQTGIEYCATYSQVKDKDIIYIINPEGVYYLKEKFPEVPLYTIMFKVNKEQSIQRLRNRGDKEEVLQKRLSSEIQEFIDFQNSHKYDVLLENNDTLAYLFRTADADIANMLKSQNN